ANFVCSLIAIAGILREASSNDLLERRGDSRRERRRLLVQNGAAQLESGGTNKWSDGACHLVKEDAQCPDIAARVGLFSTQQLRSHVGQRTRHKALRGLRRCGLGNNL